MVTENINSQSVSSSMMQCKQILSQIITTEWLLLNWFYSQCEGYLTIYTCKNVNKIIYNRICYTDYDNMTILKEPKLAPLYFS